MIYLLLLFATILWYIMWEINNKRKFASLNGIPGPTPYPIFGNILEFGLNPVDKLKNLVRLQNTYGNIIKAWIGPQNLYVLSTDPEFCEFILSSPKYIKKAADYDVLISWLRNGLLLSKGGYWQKRRKIITPAFHFKILEDFVSVFNTGSNKLIQRLAQNVEKKECDIYPYITACTLDIICETAMGASVHAQDNSENEYVQAVKTVCNIVIERVFSAWKQFDTLFQFSSSYREQTKALNVIHSFSKSVVEQRREKLKNNNTTDINDSYSDMGIKKKMVFLDVLLQSNIDGQPLSDEDIREEVDTFMFEGHDTTASAIAYSIYELARNPEIQDKAFAEVREIFKDNKNYQLTIQDLNNMKYLDLISKEVLRMYPSVPFIARTLEEDVTYKGKIYPKGLAIVIFIYGMQRRADLFPEPEKFNPDRFLTKNDNNPFSYVPFSAGPRNCIGQKFAMYEIKSTMAKILMNFELLPADSKHDLVLSGEVILKTANGVHVQLKERKY